MNLTYDFLNQLSKMYGDTFYLLDSEMFSNNYSEMLSAFQKIYSNTHIAYSYKTNYIPKLCRLVELKNGYAEVVSEMELWLARQIGVKPDHIYFNGPYKKEKDIVELMLMGGHVNIDSYYEAQIVTNVSKLHPDIQFTIGIRCNMDIGQDEVSRFGFDENALYNIIQELNGIDNLAVTGLHCHLPFRSLDSYKKRIEVVKRIIDSFSNYQWDYISLGGGYMGKVDKEFASLFSFMPPSFEEYAQVVAGGFKKIFENSVVQPKLIIEPGSALVANAMSLVTKVINIKQIKNKYIANLSGSTYNMNPSVKSINRPMRVFGKKQERKEYDMIDLAGYTCIESDYMYKGYSGKLGVGDYVIFGNVGSYSMVMKPPFILPDIAIIDINSRNEVNLVRKAQTPEAIFTGYLN